MTTVLNFISMFAILSSCICVLIMIFFIKTMIILSNKLALNEKKIVPDEVVRDGNSIALILTIFTIILQSIYIALCISWIWSVTIPMMFT